MEVNETCANENSVTKQNTLPDHGREALNRAINDIIKMEGYVTYNVNNRIINSGGDSFMGALCEVDIQGNTVDGEKKSNVFIKISNPDDHQVGFIDLPQAYYNELYLYKELSNIYSTLQEEFNVPLEERYRMVKFYDECNQEVIALENMRQQGFATYHRTEMVSLDFIELALIELAKFHTLSFVLERTRPTYFERKIKNMKTVLIFNEEWVDFVNVLTEPVIAFVNKDVEIKLVTFFKNFTKKYSSYMEDGNCIRCLCHGDYRSSNILMKNVGGAISKVIPIDYQLAYYGCPVLDFLYLVFGSTDREFRKEHLSHLKELYYDTLKKFLGYFNMAVEIVYPRKEFERVFKEKLDFGFMTALITVPILFGSNNMDGLTATAATTQEVTDECKRRLVGTIEEFLEWGYL